MKAGVLRNSSRRKGAMGKQTLWQRQPSAKASAEGDTARPQQRGVAYVTDHPAIERNNLLLCS